MLLSIWNIQKEFQAAQSHQPEIYVSFSGVKGQQASLAQADP